MDLPKCVFIFIRHFFLHTKINYQLCIVYFSNILVRKTYIQQFPNAFIKYYVKRAGFLSCRWDDCFLLHFNILRNNALTMTSGCDPWPWPLQDITNTSVLIEFRSELYDVWRYMEDKNDINITFSPDSLIYITMKRTK